MKKLLLTTTLVAMFGFVNAQTEEGGWLVGGSTNLSFVSADNGGPDNTNTFSLGTKAGYFIMDNLAAGLNLGFGSSKTGDVKSNGLYLGPFARYYFGGTFYAGLGYAIQKSKFDGGAGEFTSSGGEISFEAGYPIFLLDNVAIEPSLNYNTGTGDFDNQSDFGLNVGIFLYF